MREILFRGKRTDNGEWVYGYYCEAEMFDHEGVEHFIIEYSCDGSQYYVNPSTVGQYTGLTDKNGVKIFEGDILKWDEKEWGGHFLEVARWNYALFNMRQSDWHEFCEIVGNIYDNPELIDKPIN